MVQSETGGPPLAAGELRSVPPASNKEGASHEAGLVRLAQSGDREAFAELYECYASTVHGVLLSMVRPQEAGDLVQEVFLSALRSLDRLEKPERVGAWLCTIARNRARDVYKQRRPEALPEEDLQPAREEPQGPADVSEAAGVLEVLRELPRAYSETLTLRLVECLTGPEIALRTGLTHGSVRVNLHRGMKLLRERLAQLGLQGGTP